MKFCILVFTAASAVAGGSLHAVGPFETSEDARDYATNQTGIGDEIAEYPAGTTLGSLSGWAVADIDTDAVSAANDTHPPVNEPAPQPGGAATA